MLTGSPGLGQTRHGAAPDGAACRGGRMHWGAWATQAAPRSSRQSDLVAVLPIVTHTPTPPHVAFVRAPADDSSHQTEPASGRKGVRPLFKRVNSKRITHATPPYVDFYTGERLAMGSTAIGSVPSRVSTYGAVATGLPIASTPVGSRSPVLQFPCRGSNATSGRSRRLRTRRSAAALAR